MIDQANSFSTKERNNFIKNIYWNQTLSPLKKTKINTKTNFIPTNCTIIQLIKQNKQICKSIIHQENQITILGNQQKSLVKKIKKLKKRHSQQIKTVKNSSPLLKKQSICSSPQNSTSYKLHKYNCNINFKNDNKLSRSLYNFEKKSLILKFRKDKQLLKTIIQDNRTKYIQSKKKHVSEHQQQRWLAKEQTQYIRGLKMLKVKKEKENTLLLYEQMNLQSIQKQSMLCDIYSKKEERIKNLVSQNRLFQIKGHIKEKDEKEKVQAKQ